MSYLALARKWRPKTFKDVIGQEHISKVLCNALDNDRLHHAWLFTGTRGVGKTTLARIFAKSLNCEQGVSSTPCQQCAHCKAIDNGSYAEFYEIDAASRTGVDDTKSMLENVKYKALTGRYKVYLIDEVHMFSNSSFNALLKTLEEPPPHIKFLLATTDPQKLPTTILSRCLQLSLTRLSTEQIKQNMQNILTAENTEFEDQGLEYIAHAADGSIRDSLSLLDQAIALGNNQVNSDTVQEMMGLNADSQLIDLLQALANRDAEQVISIVRKITQVTSQFSSLVALWLEHFHQLALLKQLGKGSLSSSRIKDTQRLEEICQQFDLAEIHLMYDMILKAEKEIKFSPNPEHTFEMLILRLLAFRPIQQVENQPIVNETVANATNEATSDVKKK